MNIHKNIRLTPHNRQAIWRAYTRDKQGATASAAEYKVGRPTIYRIPKAARLKLPVPQKSTGNRFKQARCGIKRLAKIGREIEEKLEKQARRYHKSYPGEMVRFGTKRLPRLQKQAAADPFEHTRLWPLTTLPANRTQCLTAPLPVPLSFCSVM